MAKNASGTHVHVHSEGKPSVVVAPGEDFPDGYNYDSSLTDEPEDAEDLVVPGPSQTVSSSSAEVQEGFRAMKVADLRSALDAAGVEYNSDDRKDALIEKAEAAGLQPQGSEG